MQAINQFKSQLKEKGPILGIDFGTVTIGISISDTKRIFALPSTSIKNNKLIIEALNKIIIDRQISGIVIGYPLEPSGYPGKTCKQVDEFIAKLNTNLPVFYQDERLSTKAVKAILKDTSWSRRKKDKLDNALAASSILQTALNLLNNSHY